jgi:hypothetical protein
MTDKPATPMIPREMLAGIIERIDALEGKIEEGMKPWRGASYHLHELRDELLDGHPSIVGSCEGCSKVLFEGDLGSHGEDYKECEECSATWTDLERGMNSGDLTFEDLDEARASIAEYKAAGGDMSAKNVHPL